MAKSSQDPFAWRSARFLDGTHGIFDLSSTLLALLSVLLSHPKVHFKDLSKSNLSMAGLRRLKDPTIGGPIERLIFRLTSYKANPLKILQPSGIDPKKIVRFFQS